MTDKFDNIDEYMRASDIIQLFEAEYDRSVENGKKHRKADGTAKKGMATAVMAADADAAAADAASARWALRTIAKKMSDLAKE